jgi:hypothetical protein
LENSEALAIESGRAYSQRRKSAHRTDESEFSFSQKWPTPRAAKEEAEEAGKRRDNPMLSTVVTQQLWPTASTRDYHAQGLNHNIASKSDSLATKVQRDWPTASARDYKDTPGMRTDATNPDGSRRDRTVNDERYWRTPGASDGEGGVMQMIPGKAGKYKLRDHVVNWATPTANQPGGTAEAFLERKRKSGKMGVSLTDLGMQVQAVDGRNLPDQINTTGKSHEPLTASSIHDGSPS